MKIMELEYKGEVYVFETTIKARAEIKDITQKNVKDFSASEYIEIMAQVKQCQVEGAKIEKLPDGEEKEELASLLNEKLMPLIDKLNIMNLKMEQVELPTYDFLYIILKNTKRFKGNLSKDMYEDMIYELEEKVGEVEAFKMMEEAKQKAFTVFEEMTKVESKMKKQSSQSNTSKAN